MLIESTFNDMTSAIYRGAQPHNALKTVGDQHDLECNLDGCGRGGDKGDLLDAWLKYSRTPGPRIVATLRKQFGTGALGALFQVQCLRWVLRDQADPPRPKDVAALARLEAYLRLHL